MDRTEQEIGKAAGKIWNELHSTGHMSRSKIAKATGLSDQLTNRGIGWLAREGKIDAQMKGRVEVIGLKD